MPASSNMIPQIGTDRSARLRALIVVALCFSQLGCSTAPYAWARDIPAERAKPEEASTTIGPRDVLAIAVVGQATLSQNQSVGVDGNITFPDVGSVTVSGLTVEQAAVHIQNRLKQILTEPKVSVVVISRSIEVSLLGEVASPGKYILQSGNGVADAIALAGDLTEYASPSDIYLVRVGEPLRIRFRMKDLLRGGASAHAFALRDGDLIVVE